MSQMCSSALEQCAVVPQSSMTSIVPCPISRVVLARMVSMNTQALICHLGSTESRYFHPCSNSATGALKARSHQMLPPRSIV